MVMPIKWQNWLPGILKGIKTESLQNFSSYVEHTLLKPIDSVLQRPESLHDTVALVLLSNADYEQLMADANAILSLEERELLFDVS